MSPLLILSPDLPATPDSVVGPCDLVLESAPPGVAWGACRRWLGRLRHLHGDRDFMAAIEPAADAVAVILRRLPPRDPHAHASLRASEDGLLTHNPLVRRPLVDGLSAALGPLLRGLTVLVPDVGAVDLPSLGLLVGMGLRGEGPARVVLGAPERPVVDHPLWRREPELLADALGLWALQPGVEMAPLPEGLEAQRPPPGPWDALDDQAEQHALALLADAASGAVALRPSDLQRILDAGRAAFAAHDPHAALRLCLGLLDLEPELPVLERARLHRRAALSAYNRQVQFEDNAQLASLLDTWLLAAFEGETDTAARSHLAYRLCINYSRRQGDQLEGERWGLRAIALADALPAGPAAWHRAWARNGLAYVRARQGRSREAIEEMLGAWADASAVRPEDAPDGELPLTAAVLADNLAELHVRARDTAGAIRWQAELMSLETASLGEPLLAHRRTVQILRQAGRLTEAEAAAGAGLAAAERALEVALVDLYRVERADLRYRLGDFHGSHADFEAVLAARERGASVADRDLARVSTALAASRAGDAERALSLLDGVLDEATDPGQQAELLAAQGLTAARAQAAELAEQYINAAIETAVGLGSRDVLLRVAVAAGEALLALGQSDQAADAFARAWEIAGTGQPPPPPADVFGAVVGQLITRPSDAWIARASRLLPEALEEAETWPRLSTLRALRPEQVALIVGLT